MNLFDFPPFAHPALWFLLGAVLIPFTRGILTPLIVIAAPSLSLTSFLLIEHGSYLQFALLGHEITPLRLDKLSFIFTLVFHIAAIVSAVYAFHLRDKLQHVSGLIYAGSAIGACLAGDLLTLFFFWELTAISSVFLIWARRNKEAYNVGMRYLIIQVSSGVLLLLGAALWGQTENSLAFNYIGIDSIAGKIILLAFGIKAAFPLLHNWLQDAYPNATVTGTVVLSAFTTKLAIYALARGFAGTEMLIWVGCIMAAFPLFFAVIENDLRKVLSYSLNNQLGFMVVGVGIGTELALNGAAAHAFAHIIYKGLLFMSVGAVLHRVGTAKASELGGLYKSMPLTALFCIIGSMSISAFPLFSGFVTKSMIMSAAGEAHMPWVFLVLLLASAGVLDHSGIKIPFFTFFAHDSGKRCKEAPPNMLLAMFFCAFLCIAIGVYPSALYQYLPFPVTYEPYTMSHVVTQLQLLFFAILGFVFLFSKGWYPPEIKSVNLDTDWLYRKALPKISNYAGHVINEVRRELMGVIAKLTSFITRSTKAQLNKNAALAQGIGTSNTLILLASLMCALLTVYLLYTS